MFNFTIPKLTENFYYFFAIFLSVSTPESWSRFTEENIKRSASERIQSDEYMNAADNLVKETSNDIWNQWNGVNSAFEQRVYESNEAKEKIQNHLNAVNNFEKIISDCSL